MHVNEYSVSIAMEFQGSFDFKMEAILTHLKFFYVCLAFFEIDITFLRISFLSLKATTIEKKNTPHVSLGKLNIFIKK